MVSGSPQVPLSQTIQGASSSQSLTQGTPRVSVGQNNQNLAQFQLNPPYQGEIKTPIWKNYEPLHVNFQGHQI